MKLLKATENQQQLVASIIEKPVTICAGPSGSGKSLFALKTAVSQLEQGNYSKIVIARNIINVGKNIGSLPGNITERISPYYSFIREYLSEALGSRKLEKYIKDGTIKFIPVEMMRGHTYHDSICILEESQNTSPIEIKTFISRVGKNSRAVVVGDLRQVDGQHPDAMNGLRFCLEYLDNLDFVGIVKMSMDDIKRNDHLGKILRIFNEEGY